MADLPELVDVAVFLDEQRLVYEQLRDWRLVAHETEEADHDILWDGHALAFPSHLHAGNDVLPRTSRISCRSSTTSSAPG